MEHDVSTAYSEGERDRYNGYYIDDRNTYPEHSPEYDSYQTGWLDADYDCCKVI